MDCSDRSNQHEKGDKSEKESEAADDSASEPKPAPLLPGSFAVEFASLLDAREFLFHAPTFGGLGIVALPLWDDLSRFAREMALDYGTMQRLESFYYRHRNEKPRNAKTRKMEPKQIYVHGDYKKVWESYVYSTFGAKTAKLEETITLYLII